jgi:hypothetical protein
MGAAARAARAVRVVPARAQGVAREALPSQLAARQLAARVALHRQALARPAPDPLARAAPSRAVFRAAN